jgi:hypothetical protein
VENQSWARNGMRRETGRSRVRHPRCEGCLSEKIKTGWIGHRRILTPIPEVALSYREVNGDGDMFVTINHDGREMLLVDTESPNRLYAGHSTMLTIGMHIVMAFQSAASAMNDRYPCDIGMPHSVCLCAIAPPRRERRFRPWDGGAVICSIGSGSHDEFWSGFHRGVERAPWATA